MKKVLMLVGLVLILSGCQQVTAPDLVVQKVQWGDSREGDQLIRDVWQVCGYGDGETSGVADPTDVSSAGGRIPDPEPHDISQPTGQDAPVGDLPGDDGCDPVIIIE